MKKLTQLILSMLILSSPAFANSQLSSSIFHIAPWGYRNANGDIAGLEYEIIKEIEKDIGEPIKINLVPYNRMIYQLKNGSSDFSIFFRSPKSEESAEPLVKWGSLDIIIISKQGNPIKDYDDLRGQKIGVRLGGFFDKRFDNDKKLYKVTQRDYTECIEKFKAGKLDAVIGTAATLYYELQKQNISIDSLAKPYFIGQKEDWLHFSRLSTNKDKKDKIKASVEKLIKNGTFQRIFSKYLPKKWLRVEN